jgi:hypothetical protein
VTALPNWVIDVVIALDKYEDEHAKEHTCLAPALDHVPAEIRAQARGVRDYLAQIPVPTDADPDDPTPEPQ